MGKSILKWFGIIAGSLIVLLLLFGAAMYMLGSSRLEDKFDVAVESIAIQSDSATLAHGEHLVKTWGCSDCHGQDLGGAKFMDNPAMGSIWAANLTSGQGGIGSRYTDIDWIRSLRHGITPEGISLVFMPSRDYYYLNDDDLGALIAYIKTVPLVDRPSADRNPGPIARFISAFNADFLEANAINQGAPRPESVEPGVTVAYGRYLGTSCRSCHGQDLAGGIRKGPPDAPLSANITPDPQHGIGTWSEEDLFRLLRTSKRPDGTMVQPEMPRSLASLTDDEIRAVWLYLKTVTPVAQTVPRD